MKVLICGSRTWPDKAAVVARVNELPSDTEVIVGDARSVDTWAFEAASARGLCVRQFFALWDVEGNRAGILRNLRMLDENPDLVIAFQAGSTRGTEHTVRAAEKRGVRVELHSPRELVA